MAEEIAAQILHFVGTCFKVKDLAPSWILIKIPIFLIATGLAVFDTYTDWKVVLAFQRHKHVIGNPLIAHNPSWLNAWYFFTVIGTILTVVSFLHDGLNLVYSMVLCCSRCCSKSCCRKKKSQMKINLLKESGISEGETETEVEKEKPKDETITDPCRCCYRWGFNVATRIETLSSLQLWFQNIPLLVISIFYAATKATCETPVRIHEDELSDILLHVGISAIAAMLATSFRLIRSAYRMFQTMGVRIKGKYCCKRLLPKAMDAVYPPDTRCQYLIFPYYAGLILQYLMINLMGIGALYIWFYFLLNKVIPSDNSSLGVYLHVTSGNDPYGHESYEYDFRLFNVSGNLIPPPKDPYIYLDYLRTKYLPEPIHCLSAFEYRPTEAQIFYNTAQLRIISSDGSFCNASYQKDSDLGNYDNCHRYFTNSEYNLYSHQGIQEQVHLNGLMKPASFS